MTYLAFHLIFIIPPIVVLFFVQRRPVGGAPGTTAFRALALIATAAFLYTILWDNYLVYRGVWSYPLERVVGRIAYVPIEEYAFFVLQPILSGLFYFAVRGRSTSLVSENDSSVFPTRLRGNVTLLLCGLTLVGVALLLWGGPHALYLGLILTWCSPVLAGLTWIGIEKIWTERRLLLVSIAVPTVYLWVADRIAIGSGIWHISEKYSLGINPFGFPIEEAVFFLVTNWMAVQGIAMLLPRHSA